MGSWGAFGKIPSLGDFLRADAPPGFVDAWDGWLQGSLLTARRELGQRWQPCYLSAPIWRFTIAPALAGRLPVAGILMPSVDRVGRQFPLTLMAALPQGTPEALWHFASEPVFARLEDLALETLERGLERGQLLQRLSGLPRATAPPPPRLIDRDGAILAMPAQDRSLAAEVAACLLEGRLRRPALWSTLLAEGARLMVTDGLPGDGHAAALFDMSAPAWSAGGQT